MEYISNSFDETQDIAKKLAANAKSGDIFCLTGDLGVGKTAFSKGFALGLDIFDDITSPTFTILNEYNGRLKLFHFDVYRLSSGDDFFDSGLDEYFYADGICLIEWAEIVQDALPENVTWITIYKDLERGFDFRKIVVEEISHNSCN